MRQPSMGQMYRQTMQNMMQGQGANQYGASARTQAQQSAMAIGAGNAGVSPALAARQAGQAAAQQSAQIGAQVAQMRMQEQQAGMQQAFQQEQADNARVDRAIGMGLQVAGSGLGMLMSDAEAKMALGGGRQAADRFIDSLEPQRYEYRPETGQPGGTRLGVMAQDVERGAPEMVGTRGDGYRGIDRDQAIGAILASVGRIGERLDGLERRRGGRR